MVRLSIRVTLAIDKAAHGLLPHLAESGFREGQNQVYCPSLRVVATRKIRDDVSHLWRQEIRMLVQSLLKCRIGNGVPAR
jgi:hypothetical protein